MSLVLDLLDSIDLPNTGDISQRGDALSRMKKANVAIEYGPAEEPWGVRPFFVRDPFGKLVNILVHK